MCSFFKNKKIKMILLLCLTLLITGCVKYNGTMTIKKDKSMTYEVVYGVNKSFTQGEKLFDDEQKKALEQEGYTVSDYTEGDFVGVKLYKKFDNIDDVSVATEPEFYLLEMENKNTSGNLFKVKSGFFWNKYTAKFKLQKEDTTTEDEEDETSDDYEIIESDDSWDWSTTTETDNSSTNNLMNMELTFTVNLPYKPLSTNAPSKDKHGKTLTWDLSKMKSKDTVDFEFIVLNTRHVYLFIGGFAIIIFTVITKNIRDKNKPSEDVNNVNVAVDQKETYQTPIDIPQNTVTTGETNSFINNDTNNNTNMNNDTFNVQNAASNQMGIEAFMNGGNTSTGFVQNTAPPVDTKNMDVNTIMSMQMNASNQPQQNSVGVNQLMGMSPNNSNQPPVQQDSNALSNFMNGSQAQGGIPEINDQNQLK